jgi:hypothetical protein
VSVSGSRFAMPQVSSAGPRGVPLLSNLRFVGGPWATGAGRDTHGGLADDTGQYLGGAGAIPARRKPVAQVMDKRVRRSDDWDRHRRRAPWECPANSMRPHNPAE